MISLTPPRRTRATRASIVSWSGVIPSSGAIRPDGFSSAALLDAMTRDKKVADGRLRLVLARGIGRAFAGAEVDPAALRDLLDTTP